MTSGVFMTELAVADMVASLRFYHAALGLPVVLQDAPNGFALLGTTHGKLALKQRAEPTPGDILLHFEVAGLAAALTALHALGIAPVGELKTSHEGYTRAILRDPDGHTVVLFEWHPAS